VRILIDVANGRVSEELLETLVRAGHEVERGSATSTRRPFDVVVVGSVDIAERLRRERPHDAIIVFTRIGDVEARIRALDAGASDAVDAGFPIAQVAARIGAAGRRAAAVPRDREVVEIDGCRLDLSACTGERGGEPFALTKREVDIVRWLSRRAGQVVSRPDLLQHVWGLSPRTETRAVDVAIAGLRAKLERDPSEPTIIVSVKGAGYRWGS
jgi:DNA-binding response OmpR family regulator